MANKISHFPSKKASKKDFSGQDGQSGQGGQGNQSQVGRSAVHVSASSDDRTNTVVVTGPPEFLAVQLLRKTGGKVLKHDEADEQRVSRGPRSGLVANQAELKRKMCALRGDRGVDASGVALQKMKLIGRQRGQRTIGGSANRTKVAEARKSCWCFCE